MILAMRDVIYTPNAPRPIGPFSQAIRANGFVFLSGTVAMDPATGNTIGGDVGVQTERILQNLGAVLEAAGSSFAKVVRCGVFLTDMNDFGGMNEVYARYFPSEPPARTTVEVTRLPKDVLVEIDMVALS